MSSGPDAGERVIPTKSAAARLSHALHCLLCAATVAFGGSATLQRVAAQEIDYAPQIEAFMDEVARARRQIDRSLFDVSALAFEFGSNTPEELSAWVRDNIAFEQYRGVLRGAQGTLLARAGNALDQALMLASLMGDAGYDARIVHGRLAPADARKLVLQMGEQRPLLPTLDANIRAALVDVQDVARAAAAGGDFGGGTPSERLDFDALAARAASAAGVVLDRLAALGVGVPESALAWLTDEAREYFWVEYRPERAGAWREAHPAFAAAAPPSSIEPLDYFAGTLPAELQHRLRVDITIEQKLGDQLRTHVLLNGWERPTANLNGVPLTFANVPWSLGAWEDLREPLDHVLRNGVFVTVFLGEVVSGLAFDTNGNVIPLAEAATAAAALFQTLGNQLESAAAALGALGGPQDSGAAEDLIALTAQWIDYTLIAPGGQETTFRRTVLDRIGPEARAAGRAEIGSDRAEFLPLIGSWSAMTATGAVPATFATDRYLEALLESRVLLEHLASQLAEYRPEAIFPTQIGAPPEVLQPLDLFRLFDLVRTGGEVAYRAEPTFAVIGQSFRGAGDKVIVEHYVDVVQNAKRAFVTVDDDLLMAVSDAIRTGVWETVVENVLVGRDQEPIDRFNTVDHVEGALRAGHELAVLRPADSTAAAAYGPEAAAAIARDLAAGYWVLVPPPDVTLGDRTAWWRVRPDSGETLGIISDGRGGTLEYLPHIILGGVILAVVATHLEVQQCKKGITGEAGARLQLENPREYDRQVLGCTYHRAFRRAVLRIDDALKEHDEKCKTSAALQMTGMCD